MNNRKTLVIIALAVLLCGLLAFRGTKAEEDGKTKIIVILVIAHHLMVSH